VGEIRRKFMVKNDREHPDKLYNVYLKRNNRSPDRTGFIGTLIRSREAVMQSGCKRERLPAWNSYGELVDIRRDDALEGEETKMDNLIIPLKDRLHW